MIGSGKPSALRWMVLAVAGIAALAVLVFALRPAGAPTATAPAGSLEAVAQALGLTPQEAEAALQTFVPPGRYDEYLMFASGGHSGQVLVIGVPSMRLLRVIGVFTAEPWQGYGYAGESARLLRDASPEGELLNWGDTHHPALSQTNAVYDGEWLFINDKAHGRIGVVSLRDFQTKQLVKNPLIYTNHGVHVTPNTEYVVESVQYPGPFPPRGMELTQANYDKHFRGLVTLWKFDREQGRIVPEESFAIETPPYWQDLVNVGKGESDGFVFINSFNTERAIGGVLEGNPPLESGVSQRDMDYLHVIDWRLAEQLVAQGKYETLEGLRVIRLETAAREGVLHFIPEPKSPHGVDTSPDGRWIVVAGKLDPNVTVYDVRRIKQAILDKRYDGRDPYGVAILPFDATVAAQVNIGLGPLHTQFDDKGYAYTSLYVDSAVAKWTLGEPYFTGDQAWKLVEKVQVQYNIGHLSAIQGDTAKPLGKYLVAMNKWSQDQFTNVGPLLPQNFQLIDISGDKMKLLSNTPIGVGEPHYAQMIPVSTLKPIQVYPAGTDAGTFRPSPYAIKKGEERIVRSGGVVDVYMTAMRSHFTPDHIKVTKGDRVRIHVTSIEQGVDVIHGFGLSQYNVHASLEPGATVTIEFVADRPGVFPFYCSEFCSALHLEMMGYLLVEP